MVIFQKKYLFKDVNAYFLEKATQHSSLTMFEKNIVMPLFYKKYFINCNGLLGPRMPL